ncbi:MAG TPA: TerC family protein [Myxococcales bacterium]|nr:TerC family protein [Myxococcales bacterium]
MVDILFVLHAGAALIALATLEIILGMDNIVFIIVLTEHVPESQKLGLRRMGIVVALASRIMMLLFLSRLLQFDEVWITFMGLSVSPRSILMLLGGVFLISKAAFEVYKEVEGPEDDRRKKAPGAANVFLLLAQIFLLDIVFSLDSLFTAFGMTHNLPVMIAAMIVAMVVMFCFAGPLGGWIEGHSSIKILALSFLILVGVMLMSEGIGQEVHKSTVYVAMAFTLCVEILNIRRRAKLRDRNKKML